MPPRTLNLPRRSGGAEPPPVMTWAKAAPALVIALLFDAIRFMFEWFVFFGPALGAVYCTIKATGVISYWTAGLFGSGAAATACAALGGVLGFAGAGVIAPFGMIMAMVTGFAGWLFVGIYLLATNSRIFKENMLWFVAGLLVSEVPFVGSVPAITVSTWRMYHRQIAAEKKAFKKFESEQTAAQEEEVAAQQALLLQAQAEEEARADAERLAQEEAQEIPEQEPVPAS